MLNRVRERLESIRLWTYDDVEPDNRKLAEIRGAAILALTDLDCVMQRLGSVLGGVPQAQEQLEARAPVDEAKLREAFAGILRDSFDDDGDWATTVEGLLVEVQRCEDEYKREVENGIAWSVECGNLKARVAKLEAGIRVLMCDEDIADCYCDHCQRCRALLDEIEEKEEGHVESPTTHAG